MPRFLAAVPKDTFAERPPCCRRTEDGLVIYSVGVDGKDNGGILGNGVAPGTDIGFRLWDVEHRRQPAPPMKPEENLEPK